MFTSFSIAVFSQILAIFDSASSRQYLFMQPCEMLSNLTALRMKAFLGEKNKSW